MEIYLTPDLATTYHQRLQWLGIQGHPTVHHEDHQGATPQAGGSFPIISFEMEEEPEPEGTGPA